MAEQVPAGEVGYDEGDFAKKMKILLITDIHYGTDTNYYFKGFPEKVFIDKKEGFRALFEDSGRVLAAFMVFVTDTLGDLREADQAGVPTIAVTWGAHGKEHFSAGSYPNLIAVVDSIPELDAILEG